MVRSSVTISWVAVAWQDDFRSEVCGACDRGVDVIHLEPEEQAVSGRQVIRIADWSVVVILFPAMELQDQLTGMNQPFVVRPPCALSQPSSF